MRKIIYEPMPKRFDFDQINMIILIKVIIRFIYFLINLRSNVLAVYLRFLMNYINEIFLSFLCKKKKIYDI